MPARSAGRRIAHGGAPEDVHRDVREKRVEEVVVRQSDSARGRRTAASRRSCCTSSPRRSAAARRGTRSDSTAATTIVIPNPARYAGSSRATNERAAAGAARTPCHHARATSLATRSSVLPPATRRPARTTSPTASTRSRQTIASNSARLTSASRSTVNASRCSFRRLVRDRARERPRAALRRGRRRRSTSRMRRIQTSDVRRPRLGRRASLSGPVHRVAPYRLRRAFRPAGNRSASAACYCPRGCGTPSRTRGSAPSRGFFRMRIVDRQQVRPSDGRRRPALPRPRCGACEARARGAVPVDVGRAQRCHRRRVRAADRDPRVARDALAGDSGRRLRQGALEPRGGDGDAASCSTSSAPTSCTRTSSIRSSPSLPSSSPARAGVPGRPDAARLRDDQREPDRRARRLLGPRRDEAPLQAAERRDAPCPSETCTHRACPRSSPCRGSSRACMRRTGSTREVLPNFVSDAADELGAAAALRRARGIVFLGRLRPEKGALDVVELARKVPAIRGHGRRLGRPRGHDPTRGGAASEPPRRRVRPRPRPPGDPPHARVSS